MNNTWKLSILSGAVLLASGAFAAAGCTVTTTSGGDDGGTFTGNDSGTDTGTTTDGGAKDTGTTTDGGACSATATCPIIGSSKGVTFDNCATCDKCMATSCCSETTACFTKDADGGQSDCEQLVDCIQACDQADGGATCNSACAQAHQQGLSAAQALDACLNGPCGATDGGTAACQ